MTAGGNVGRPHEVQQVTITLTRTATGYLVESEALPGWAGHAHSLTGLRDVVAQAFREHEAANYARFRGVPYDASSFATDAFDDPGAAISCPPDERRHPAEPPVSEVPRIGWSKGADVRPDTHHPAEWTPLPDGRWRSPKGNTYKPESAMVASVVARRAELGLPVSA